MHRSPHEIALGILEEAFVYEDGEWPFPDPRTAFDGKEDAVSFLRELPEEDLGDDAAAWRGWFADTSPEMLRLHYDELAHKARARRRSGSG